MFTTDETSKKAAARMGLDGIKSTPAYGRTLPDPRPWSDRFKQWQTIILCVGSLSLFNYPTLEDKQFVAPAEIRIARLNFGDVRDILYDIQKGQKDCM